MKDKDKEIENLKRDMRAKDNEIKRKDKEIKQLDKEIKQLDNEIKQLDNDSKQLDNDSKQLKRGYERIEERNEYLERRCKHFTVNNSTSGLWENNGNTNFVIRKCGGTLTNSHVDRETLAAFDEEADFSLVSPKLDEKILDESSCLLAAFNKVDSHGCRLKTYGNKADVQSYVNFALMDAVNIVNGLMGDQDILIVRWESEIFSNKPDHTVVRVGSFRTPILVVETKQPVETIHKKVWGQICDYHGILRVYGHPNPFVVLSTFEQSWMTWDYFNQVCTDIATTTDIVDRIERPLQRLSANLAPHPISESPSLRKRHNRPEHVVESTNPQKGQTDRRLWRSKPFESKDLVKLFVNAILCSLSNFHGSPSMFRSNKGYPLRNKPVMTLVPKNYKFETISLQVLPVEFKSSNFVHQEDNGYHILDLLGSGSTSKVFLATTTMGHECVIKMYVRKYDETNNYMAISKEDFETDATNSTKAEKEMYELIYGMEIPVVTLFHHKCLILPYFRPIERDERDLALEHLRKVLRCKFRVTKDNTTTYYAFSDTDQRWRHCGYMGTNQDDTAGEFFIYDLANLETCASEAEHDLYIERHIATLKSRNSPVAADGQSA